MCIYLSPKHRFCSSFNKIDLNKVFALALGPYKDNANNNNMQTDTDRHFLNQFLELRGLDPCKSSHLLKQRISFQNSSELRWDRVPICSGKTTVYGEGKIPLSTVPQKEEPLPKWGLILWVRPIGYYNLSLTCKIVLYLLLCQSIHEQRRGPMSIEKYSLERVVVF